MERGRQFVAGARRLSCYVALLFVVVACSASGESNAFLLVFFSPVYAPESGEKRRLGRDE